MKPEEQIIFVAELLDIINSLQELITDHCRTLAAESKRPMSNRSLEECDDIPF